MNMLSARLQTAHMVPATKSAELSDCVGSMISILQSLLVDIDAGLLGSIADRARAETFDDLLDHASAYQKQGQKLSGVLAGVAFEDAIRQIARKHQVVRAQVEDIINDLAKKDVLSATKAKRAKVAAHVRTKATHALWDEFDLSDVKTTIDFARELIGEFLDP